MVGGEDLTVEMILTVLKVIKIQRFLKIKFSLAENVLKSVCVLSSVPAGLEIRHGHEVIDLSSGDQLPHSCTLLVRCHGRFCHHSVPGW